MCFRKQWLYILLLLPGWIGTGCDNFPWKNSHLAVLKGNIQLPEGRIIYIYSYSNTAEKYLGIKTVIDSAYVERNGNYSFVLRWNTPSVFDLRAESRDGGHSVSIFLTPELYLCPGDNITLNFTGKDNHPEISPTNPAERNNDYLLKMIDKFFNDTAASHEFYIGANYFDCTRFSYYCKSRHAQMDSFYVNYFKKDAPRKDFAHYALADIKYQDAFYRVKYLLKKRLKNQEVSMDSDYYCFTKPSYTNDPDALDSPSYYSFLTNYINNMYGDKLEHGDMSQSDMGVTDPYLIKFELASQYLDSLPRKIVQFNIIYNEITSQINAGVTHYNKDILHHFTANSVDSLINVYSRKYKL